MGRKSGMIQGRSSEANSAWTHPQITLMVARRSCTLYSCSWAKANMIKLFRDWLKKIAGRVRARRFRTLMDNLRYVDAGRKFTRDEMNER